METTSYCVYQFVCSCGTSYIGRTTRRLAERIREHHPSWLCQGLKRSGGTAITAHLVETEHQVRMGESFKPIYMIVGVRSKQVKQRLLSTAEAIAIRLMKPPLCVQKQTVRALDLPWPSVNATVT